MPGQQPILIDSMTFDAANGAATIMAVLIASTVADNACAMPTAAGQAPVGVAQAPMPTTINGVSSTGRTLALLTDGVAVVVANAAIVAGAFVSIAAATGRVKTATSGEYIVGQARSAAAAGGDQILVKLAISTGAKA